MRVSEILKSAYTLVRERARSNSFGIFPNTRRYTKDPKAIPKNGRFVNRKHEPIAMSTLEFWDLGDAENFMGSDDGFLMLFEMTFVESVLPDLATVPDSSRQEALSLPPFPACSFVTMFRSRVDCPAPQ